MASGLFFNESITANDSVNDVPGFAERLVRPLAFRYGLVFVAVASLLLADQALIQPLLVRLNGYAPIINLAGRQRMLSQMLAKQALALDYDRGSSSLEAQRRHLSNTIQQWSTAHRILRDGDSRQAIGPITTPQIAAALHELEPDFTAIRIAANQLATPSMADDRSVLVRTILDHEPSFLVGMEHVVAMLEAEARRRVGWLRLFTVAAVVVAIILLASLYAFVVRPATKLIRQQLRMLAASDLRHRALADQLSGARDELERRVQERTSELNAANKSLRQEVYERQAIEARMRRLSSDLAHASRVTALGQLATGLAHELNQPLGAIANYAGACELLLEGETGDHRMRHSIAEVKQSALRAGEIVRRMRNFVRHSPEQMSLVDLNDLVREVAELCEPELRRCEVELTLSLSQDAISVMVDPIQIQQVVVNLVQNAIQGMHGVDGRKRLGIRTSSTREGGQVDVADSGPGFPDDSDPFTPFFSTKAEGLGMGLAISQTIIEQHQGRIWVGNRPAGGAIVSFCLSLVRSHETGQRDAIHSLCG